MRRSMRALIVALLCLTLFVDSAKACWWLRQHGSRGRVCRPATCRPASLPRCGAVAGEPLASGEVVFVDEHAGCFCNAAIDEHAAIHQTIDQTTTHEAVEPAARVEESVVVHGPTLVVDTIPAQPAPGGPAASSVVIAPAADTPSPAAAQPMPVAATGPAVLPTPTAAQEPIPELKPAVASPSPVAPVSNEQPVLEPQAPVPAAALADPADAQEVMPAPAEDLAGGPDVKPAMPEPQEPNLFDLYGDEGDDDVGPSEEPPADTTAEEVEADAGEPVEESAASPDAEPEMSDDAAAAVEADEADSETAEPADEPAAPAADDAADEPADDVDAAPPADPEQAEADPAAAATIVPNEPMRRWTNDTGTHQAQGWLVEVRADRVRILKVNGRHTTMSTESLSAADRDYVSVVNARLAAERQGTSPAAVDTAGL